MASGRDGKCKEEPRREVRTNRSAIQLHPPAVLPGLAYEEPPFPRCIYAQANLAGSIAKQVHLSCRSLERSVAFNFVHRRENGYRPRWIFGHECQHLIDGSNRPNTRKECVSHWPVQIAQDARIRFTPEEFETNKRTAALGREYELNSEEV